MEIGVGRRDRRWAWDVDIAVGHGNRRWAWDVEIAVGHGDRGMWRSLLGTEIMGCGDRRRDRFMGFVHLWCELFIYGSDFAGVLLVICGFCFGGGRVMGSEAGVVCLSFVAFLDDRGGGGFSGREIEAFLDGGGGGGFSGRETEEES